MLGRPGWEQGGTMHVVMVVPMDMVAA